MAAEQVYILRDDECAAIAVCQSPEGAQMLMKYAREISDSWVNLRVEPKAFYSLDDVYQIIRGRSDSINQCLGPRTFL